VGGAVAKLHRKQKIKQDSHLIQQFLFWELEAETQGYLHSRVHDSVLHNSQNVEAAQGG
jgi:hypothetical protein